MNTRALLIAFGVALLALPSQSARAQDTAAIPVPSSETNNANASDQFLKAYVAVEEGQKLESNGKYPEALEKYKYAEGVLQGIRDKTPDWEPPIVKYRLEKLAEAIASLEKKIPAGGSNPAPSPSPSPNPSPSSSDKAGGANSSGG